MLYKPDLFNYPLQNTSQIHTLFSRDIHVIAEVAGQWYSFQWYLLWNNPGKWKKTAHAANILVELCVYSSTVNKREVSIRGV